MINSASYGFWNVDDVIEKKLEAQKVLKPLEIYVETHRTSVDTEVSPEVFLNFLDNSGYRQRARDQKWLQGDYTSGDKMTCSEFFKSHCPENTEKWVLFNHKNSMNGSYVIFWSANSIVNKISKFNVEDSGFLNPQDILEVSLDETLLAQYINNEPISKEEIKLPQVPAMCLNAVIAIEDQRFLDHHGVSPTGMMRALVKNIISGRKAQGGSTITQQLVKNYFLTSERTYKRKAQEILLALRFESKFSKDEILETYLNVIYMGQNGSFQVRGYGSAAKYYFQKNLEKLNLSECALMAALVNSPGLFNPWTHPDSAKKRRSLVLEKMNELQLISPEQKKLAQLEPLPTKPSSLNSSETAPYFIDAVRKQLQALNFESQGLKVLISLDPDAQKIAQDAVQSHLSLLEKRPLILKNLNSRNKSLEALLLNVENSTGLIRAAVGGRSFRLTQYNRVAESHRQIGSTMKPIVFLSALENGFKDGSPFTADTILNDEKFTIEYDHQSWSPENFSKKYLGPIIASEALAQSLNAATSKLALDIGLEKIIQTSQKLNITSQMKPLPSLALGSFELFPKELLEAYMIMAKKGTSLKTSYIKTIKDESQKIIWTYNPVPEEKFKPEIIQPLIEMMKGVVIHGSGKEITQSGFKFPSAGKTGTSNDFKDSWFAGFTQQQTTVVWVGYDDNTPSGLTGSSGALPIWLNYMKKSHQNLIPHAL